jgi:hypothetical protein
MLYPKIHSEHVNFLQLLVEEAKSREGDKDGEVKTLATYLTRSNNKYKDFTIVVADDHFRLIEAGCPYYSQPMGTNQITPRVANVFVVGLANRLEKIAREKGWSELSQWAACLANTTESVVGKVTEGNTPFQFQLGVGQRMLHMCLVPIDPSTQRRVQTPEYRFLAYYHNDKRNGIEKDRFGQGGMDNIPQEYKLD